jgi:hypothetical protein
MSKLESTVEWHTAESDAEWERWCTPSTPDSTLNKWEETYRNRSKSQKFTGNHVL